MVVSVANRFKTAVASTAAVVTTLGLVTIPSHFGDPGVRRIGLGTVQLSSVVTTDVAAVLNTGDLQSIAETKASATAADSSGPNILQNLLYGAIALAATPIWYVGFPVTLPLSIAGGIALMQIFSSLSLGFGGAAKPDILTVFGTGAFLGLAFFAAAPLVAVYSAINSIFTPAASSAAATAARRPTASDIRTRAGGEKARVAAPRSASVDSGRSLAVASHPSSLSATTEPGTTMRRVATGARSGKAPAASASRLPSR